MRRLSLIATTLLLSACQCATLPEDVLFACEPDDLACLTADAGDAGSNLDAGHDAGPGDAGGDAGSTDDAGLDAGVCNSWACALEGWSPTPVVGPVPVSHFPVPIDGGSLGWFGGVLLPDGRVLAVPHTADRFLTFEPKTGLIASFGPPPGTGALAGTARKFAGGVLVGDRVFVFPYKARFIHELDLRDGGFRAVGPELGQADGGAPHYVGGVVDAFGDVWTVSEANLPILRLGLSQPLADGGLAAVVYTGASVGGFWGAVRLPDDRILTFPKEFANNAALTRRIFVIDPSTGNPLSTVANFAADAGLQGASLLASGVACATPAGLDAFPVCVSGSGGTLSATSINPETISSFGFNATGGDGRVWAAPDVLATLVNLDEVGVVARTPTPPLSPAPSRYAWLGLVATPQGLVAIPGEAPEFLRIEVSESRPLRSLLSPYFNKL